MDQPCVHPAALRPEQLLAECDVRQLRRSGPGGQRRNKVQTAVILNHRPTGVSAEANERRSQAANRSVALFRLRLNLALGVRCRIASDDGPSVLWRSRCRNGQISVSPSHEDFPTILAEALDAISASQTDLKDAAGRLGLSSSQLVKLLKKDARAIAQINRQRREQGLYPLK